MLSSSLVYLVVPFRNQLFQGLVYHLTRIFSIEKIRSNIATLQPEFTTIFSSFFRVFYPILALDRFTGFSAQPVRWHRPLGHPRSFFRPACPMAPPTRTASLIFRPACPMAPPTRTPSLIFPPSLSDGTAHSDTLAHFSAQPVRWHRPLGQLHSFSAQPVQWHRPLGHPHSIFRPACPMAPPTRTPSLIFPPSLSNGTAHSDTFTHFSAHPVRWHRPLGHPHSIFRPSCPMAPPTRTPSLIFPPSLSELIPGSRNSVHPHPAMFFFYY